ncbi:hypothetical protein LIER_41731 [Lithospermum erythrorhizon]|uniref:Secreted protein n=1 Tax=Lithospermum erythrorhizon TaxID=34254 RepID=A0AAV3RH30_LITER
MRSNSAVSIWAATRLSYFSINLLKARLSLLLYPPLFCWPPPWRNESSPYLSSKMNGRSSTFASLPQGSSVERVSLALFSSSSLSFSEIGRLPTLLGSAQTTHLKHSWR